MHYRYWLVAGAGIVLGMIFLVAGVGKLLAPTEALQLFIFPAFFSAALEVFILDWLPYLEIAIGVLLVAGTGARLAGAIALVLTAAMATNNAWLLASGLGEEPCGCFGAAERIARARLSVMGALYLDVMMIALALLVILYHRRGFLSLRPWIMKGA